MLFLVEIERFWYEFRIAIRLTLKLLVKIEWHELRSHNPTASAEIRDNEHVHLERGHGPTMVAEIQRREHLQFKSAIQRQYAGNR